MELRPLVPELVTLHVWGVPAGRVPASAAAMLRDRRPVAQSPGHTFHRLLGTGSGTTFTPRDADPTHWALLACWSDARAAAGFERSDVVRRWDARAAGRGGERFRAAMTPLASRGSWDGRQPFGDPGATAGRPDDAVDGPVAALTRATLRWRTAAGFWRAVPPVARRLRESAGLVAAFGIGEAPVGRQGTFSIWRSAEALTAFAYGSDEHRQAIRQTPHAQWYAEELFARFAVVEAQGSVRGLAVAIGG
jgi:heme-degrading monooxygenase HmoA